jgi:2-polyprenyl-3-methyl-5-hydroxy-6-metoxy-1,4-benzoquinol methylase
MMIQDRPQQQQEHEYPGLREHYANRPYPHPQPHAPVTPERLMQIAWGYTAPLILEAAIKNKVFDVLDAAGGGGLLVEQVAQRTCASVRGLRMIMDALVGLNFLAKDTQQRYTLTPESAAFLVSTKPTYHGGILRHLSRRLLPQWLDLADVVRSGRPAERVNREDRADFFEQLVEDIFPVSYPAAKALAGELDIAAMPAPRILDLASGSGVWGIALAQANPRATVTAVDWEKVLKVTRRIAAQHGVAAQFNYVAGDNLEVNFGAKFDVVTLGHILHSEGEPRSRKLIWRAYNALQPGGTIAIAEWLPNEQRTGPTNALIFAVNMLVNTEVGDTYTFGEISGWLKDVGFENARLFDAHAGPSPLILADKPVAS